jgi:hypothetical protein
MVLYLPPPLLRPVGRAGCLRGLVTGGFQNSKLFTHWVTCILLYLYLVCNCLIICFRYPALSLPLGWDLRCLAVYVSCLCVSPFPSAGSARTMERPTMTAAHWFSLYCCAWDYYTSYIMHGWYPVLLHSRNCSHGLYGLYQPNLIQHRAFLLELSTFMVLSGLQLTSGGL